MFSSARVLIVAAFLAACAAGEDDLVTFSQGQVLGTRLPGDVRQFLGVPFAASTDGDNKWLPPQPRAPWDFVLDCRDWGAGCTQAHHNPDVPRNQSLDCLNVNVFAPTLPAGARVPVMVFFNGGAFMEGSNQGPFGMYNGSKISQNGVVVVSANYRVGAFGYLATGREGINGNFGLMDQVAALQWVQQNIAAVGGDPTQVTVFGESAGAMSIGLLLTTEHAKGLFHRAIMESNVAGMNYRNLTEAALIADAFCSQLNCSACSAACLRAAPVQSVMDSWNSATGNVPVWVLANIKHILDGFLDTGPTRDGVYVPFEPMAAVEAGTWWGKDVDIILGTNSNEGETFVFDGVNFPLPNFLAEIAYWGIFGENSTAAADIEKQPRYHYQGFSDARLPISASPRARPNAESAPHL